MALALRALRLICLAIWVGGIVFFIAGVAAVAFKNFDGHTAGTMVRGSLPVLHRLGLWMGAIYLLATIVLMVARDSHPARAVEIALVISMLALTGYLHLSVVPRMDTDRLSLGGDTIKAAQQDPDAPALHHFNRLHGLSVKLEGVVLIEGLVLLVLAPVHGRDLYDRFA
jgi:hypothetical protein